MKKRISIDTIMGWNPCSDWPRERIAKLFGRRKYYSAMEILDAKQIPLGDRIWVVLHKEIISERDMRLFACACAERALKRERKAGHDPDPRCWNAVKVSRLFANGMATAKELATARDAARAAAWAAAWDAARDAARDAAWAAAWDAARAAVRAAARDAAWAAARAAEQKWQVARLQKIIGG